ncbi:hypothetical protein UFOVP672_35 [uncultured Caudovirales phage]|uniref:Uncharacterized protein n=1 Tax=uncultured Caudovirales phage TaxID=2100421 RepID=A0A6J5NFC8_9CAUD|nr:hypothetical protein UFOVP672_35 [uncultured Caudovirales phage]
MIACPVEIDPDLAAKVAELERICVERGRVLPDGVKGSVPDECGGLRLGVADYQRRQGWLRRWEAEREEILS